LSFASAADPPPGLFRKVMAKETANEAARDDYMYRQTVVVNDLDKRGAALGEYREVLDVIFSPTHKRTEEIVGKPSNTLQRLILTKQDFDDIRNIQPLLITKDTAFFYDAKYKGEETVDDIPCWVLRIEPRQVLEGERLFDGMIWVDQSDFSVIRLEGQAVPQIETAKQENLFPHFTTIRAKVDGKYWFPRETYANDTLWFRTGPQRMRMVIRYVNYRRFSADTRIEYGK
jgi:hypothetical protein